MDGGEAEKTSQPHTGHVENLRAAVCAVGLGILDIRDYIAVSVLFVCITNCRMTEFKIYFSLSLSHPLFVTIDDAV